MQINITITVFRLLGFAKLSRKNRAEKNLWRSGAIAKSQIKRRSALFIAQNCAAKDSRRSRAIAKRTLNMGQQQLQRKNRAAMNFRCSGAIAKPKIKHKSATITAQSYAAKNLWRSGAIAKPKMKQGSATITTLTKVRNPRKIRAAAQYVYNPPPYSTVPYLSRYFSRWHLPISAALLDNFILTYISHVFGTSLLAIFSFILYSCLRYLPFAPFAVTNTIILSNAKHMSIHFSLLLAHNYLYFDFVQMP